jgi:hypothetical protein
MKIAVLDDYQNVALKSADWSPVAERAEITAFNDHLSDPLALVERLLPFDVICVMRERTPLTRSIHGNHAAQSITLMIKKCGTVQPRTRLVVPACSLRPRRRRLFPDFHLLGLRHQEQAQHEAYRRDGDRATIRTAIG